MRSVALVLVFIPALAWANIEPESFVARSAGEFVTKAPAATGQCARYLPSPQAQFTGASVLSAHILADGRVSGSPVVESSGNADLDQAASTCVEAMRLTPITAGGVPVDADWQIEVVWPDGQLRPAGTEDSCGRFYPVASRRAGHEGDTLVSFIIAEDGRVNDINVVESSGDSELDSATIACVSQFHYRPAIHDGKPVAIDGHFLASWRAR